MTVEKRRESLRGFVLGVFRISDIFESSFRQTSVDGINMVLTDVTAPAQQDVLHIHESSKGKEIQDGLGYRRELAEVAGRAWVVWSTPAPGYITERRSSLPYVIAAFGTLFVGLATAYSVFLLRRSAIIESTVQKRTKELHEVNQELERLSRTDKLTGLANRRCFDRRFLEEWRRARRDGYPVTLMLVDVDCFIDRKFPMKEVF